MHPKTESDISEVLSLLERPLASGQVWYLLDIKWLQVFRNYLFERQPVHNPGPIDNSGLFDHNWLLRRRLQEDNDFQFVPEEAWHRLVQEFGLLAPNHVISRPVVQENGFSTFCMVEVYPKRLILCKEGSEETVLKEFSRFTPLAEVEIQMRHLFSVDNSSETRLWAKEAIIKDSNDAGDQTIHSEGIGSRTVITLEVRNPDGTWPLTKSAAVPALPGLTGLVNLGHTCFMNAALQCMSNVEPLTKYFLNDEYLKDLNKDNPYGMCGEIARTYADLIKALWSGSHSLYTPREFKLTLGVFAPQFSGFRQGDTQELMAFLLDGLNEDLNRVKIKPYNEGNDGIDSRPDSVVAAEAWHYHKSRNDSVIVDTFHGLLKSSVVCPQCNYVSTKFDPFCYLSLPLKEKKERLISLLFVPNVVTGGQNPIRAIQLIELPIPMYGTIADICNSATKAVNESGVLNRAIDSESVMAADVYNHRFVKEFLRQESYSGPLNSLVIYERAKGQHSIPVYLREVRADKTTALFGRPFVINVSESSADALYEEVFQRLRHMSGANTEELKDFTLTLVNTFGSIDIQDVHRSEPLHTNGVTYLAVNLATNLKDKYFGQTDDILKITVPKQETDANTGLLLSECIEQFTKSECLAEDDSWYCPQCQSLQMAAKKLDIWSLPKILIIHLKKFFQWGPYREKLDFFVDFPVRSLNMRQYLLDNPNNEPINYDLIAVSNHRSLDLEEGHYFSYAKNMNTKSWHSLTHSKVEPITEDRLVSKDAYVLLYERRE